jgi:hypothetical protein
MKRELHASSLEPVFRDALWLAAKRRGTSKARLLREIVAVADVELGVNAAVRCWLLVDAMAELAALRLELGRHPVEREAAE